MIQPVPTETVSRFDLNVDSSPSDRELHAQIDQVLKSTGYGPLRGIHVTAHEGHVHLNGRVPTYYLKQMAQAKVMSLDEVTTLENAISVA